MKMESAAMDSTTGVFERLPEAFWLGLPVYARLWIKTDYDRVQNSKDLEGFVQKYRTEFTTTHNTTKRSAIKSVLLAMMNRSKKEKKIEL